jgi:hypothetical protein
LSLVPHGYVRFDRLLVDHPPNNSAAP